MVFLQVRGDDGGCLRQAISLQERYSQILEENLEFEVQRRAAADDEAELAAEGLAEFAEDQRIVERVVGEDAEDAAVQTRAGGEDAGGVVDRLVDELPLRFGRGLDLLVDGRLEEFDDSRHDDHGRRLVTRDVLLEILHIPCDGDGDAAAHDGDDFDGQRIGMPVGEEGDDALLLVELEDLRNIHRVGAQVSMGEHDAFRHAGGTAGVDEGGDFVRREFHAVERGGALAAATIGDVVQTDDLAAVGVGGDLRVERLVRDDDLRVGVVDDEAHLLVSERFADWDGDGADGPAGIEETRMEHAFGGDHGDAVTFLDAVFLQEAAESIRVRLQLAVGHRGQFVFVVELHQRDVFQILLCPFKEKLAEVFGKISVVHGLS